MAKKKETVEVKGAVLDFLDNELDSLEKDFGLDAGAEADDQWRISFGLLALDLLTKGGAKPGGWYTFYGGEQSTKTTLATYAAGHVASSSEVPLIAWWDYEGSSDAEYFTNMMRIARPALKVEEVFGVPGRRGWAVRPRVRLYQEAVAETFFDWLHTVLSALPDKRNFDGSWWEVYEDTKESRKLLGAKFDATLSKEKGGLWVPTDNGNAQGLVIVDSYPAMLPKNADQTEKGGGMALQARMFSEQLKKVKGRMAPKRLTVMGINQLRQKPGVVMGPTEYEPSGEALKFFCPTGDQHVLTPEGLTRVDALYELCRQEPEKRRLLMGPYGWQRLYGIKETGVSPVFEVSANSFRFKGKAGHRVLWLRVTKKGKIKYGYRRIERIKPGDYVAMSRPSDLRQWVKTRPKTYQKLAASSETDPEYNALRWVCGLHETSYGQQRADVELLEGLDQEATAAKSLAPTQEVPDSHLALAYPNLFPAFTLPMWVSDYSGILRPDFLDDSEFTQHKGMVRKICRDTVAQSLVWQKVDTVAEKGEAMTYDLCTPATGTYLCEGFVTHNSDVRIRMASRQFPGAALKQGREQEEAIDGGTDTYRYIHMRTSKNKLGGIPNSETWARVWVSDSKGVARGYCPVFDTFMFLKMTGCVSGTKNRMKVALPEFNNGEHKALSWMHLKKLVLGDKNQIKETCQELGVKPFHLRRALTKYLKDGSAFDWYIENAQGRAEESSDE